MAQTASETASEATENSQPRRCQQKAGKAEQRSELRSRGPNAKVGRKPPRHAKHSTKNGWTAPSKIARRRRMNEALGYREQGYTFAEIAAEMKVSISVAHNYVVEAMNAIPLENAKAVLAMELKRLDSLMSAHYRHAAAGDLAATAMVLRVMDQRAKLLGLYPEHGKTQVLIAPVNADGKPSIAAQIEFIVPGRREEPARPGDAPPAPPYPWQKALPAPEPMQRDAFGVWRPLGPTE
jgi:hypothetical protein